MNGNSGKDSPAFFINARFLSQPLTGVQRYSRELLRELDNIIGQTQATALCPVKPDNPPDYQNIDLQIGPYMDGNLWEQVFLLRKTRGSLLFSPANTGPYFKNDQILTIHDMSVFAYPMAYTSAFRFKYHLIFKKLSKSSKHILTVSEFSKQEIEKFLGVPPERITVTYEGWEHIERLGEDKSILDRLNIDGRPFFLVVGSLSRHKNLKIVLDANESMPQDELQIVIVGAGNSRVFKQAITHRMNNLVNAGYVRDDELKALYKRAVGLIFPSRYEGFGLPLLEAMACGCPIISSDIPSSHEICRSAALYFDPSSAEDLAQKMQIILDQNEKAKKMKNAGFDRLQHFSWEKTAAITAKVLRNLLN